MTKTLTVVWIVVLTEPGGEIEACVCVSSVHRALSRDLRPNITLVATRNNASNDHYSLLTNEFQAELDTRRAVSTVPPSTTSFMPSMTPPDEPPTKGDTRLDTALNISMAAK
ncbi:hypothetical protein B0J17DRAFT_374758 [Rhizoctonia solani]|nr:hypothetical protein B0J17DRAFT_374758 [Rhizoctonia solani]